MTMLPSQLSSKYRVFYDEQCEICQAGATWLSLLDKDGLTELTPIDEPHLAGLNFSMDEALRKLHVVSPDGNVYSGLKAVTTLALLFPETKRVGRFFSRGLAEAAAEHFYDFVASNRYALSKCRGGSCRTATQEFRKAAAPFWTCYCLGMLLRLPLSIMVYCQDLRNNYEIFRSTYRRRVDLLGGKLKMLFLNDLPSDIVPLLFGERFTAIVYDGVAIDPGGTRMRKALSRHLHDGTIDLSAVALTHHHEEHVGNGCWLADKFGVEVWMSQATAHLLMPPQKLPWSRAFIIGQPEMLTGEIHYIQDELRTASGVLQVLHVPGHCDDELAFYDAQEKLLLAGDSFMGAYFSTPNPEVDSKRWIASMEGILALDIEILVEAHGHIHTLRSDIPEIPGVVIRQDPRKQVELKLANLRWLQEQVRTGMEDGIPVRAIEASCFPWVKATAWERFASDEIIRMLTSGDFCRTQVVQSFNRDSSLGEPWPQMNKLQFISKKS